MFEAIGHDVLKLKRESIAFLTLDGVKSGEYRQLSVKEVKKSYIFACFFHRRQPNILLK